jgi:hypothetical protein
MARQKDFYGGEVRSQRPERVGQEWRRRHSAGMTETGYTSWSSDRAIAEAAASESSNSERLGARQQIFRVLVETLDLGRVFEGRADEDEYLMPELRAVALRSESSYTYSMRQEHPLDRRLLLELLADVGDRLNDEVEVTLAGGCAGMLTAELPATRTTVDCDVTRSEPETGFASLRQAAIEVAKQRGLAEDWLNNRVEQLDVLPSGWRRRRVATGLFGRLRVWCVGRTDLLAMKVYAGRLQDRTDVLDMKPSVEEVEFVRRYLDQLRVPSRNADLDQVQSALRFLDAMAGGMP